MKSKAILSGLAALVLTSGCSGLGSVLKYSVKQAFKQSGSSTMETYRSGRIVPLSMFEDDVWVNFFSKEGIESVQVYDSNGATIRQYNKTDIIKNENQYWVKMQKFKELGFTIEFKDGKGNVFKENFNKINGKFSDSYAGPIN